MPLSRLQSELGRTLTAGINVQRVRRPERRFRPERDCGLLLLAVQQPIRVRQLRHPVAGGRRLGAGRGAAPGSLLLPVPAGARRGGSCMDMAGPGWLRALE